MTECVRVAVRARPLSHQELGDNRESVVTVDENTKSLSIFRPNDQCDGKEFSYDAVFSQNASQSSIFDTSVKDIVESVLHGFNGTVMAYGQTGAGKTFTMVGTMDSDEQQGVIPRVFSYIAAKTGGSQYSVACSFVEIYNEELRDLLSSERRGSASDSTGRRGSAINLQEKPDGSVGIKGLTVIPVGRREDYIGLLAGGLKKRATGSTWMNAESSRSHSVFTIHVTCTAEDSTRTSKLNLVDLAGSERQSKTGATGDTLKEAAKINLSLSALGNVISALADAKNNSFVPYRDSKLTRLLQDSLGGNSKTVMIANIGPADYNFDESMSTLRYASRTKSIKNKPRVFEDPKDMVIRECREEIQRLREELRLRSELGKPVTPSMSAQSVDSLDPLAERQRDETNRIKREMTQYLQERNFLEHKFEVQVGQVEALQKKLELVVTKYKQLKADMGELESDTTAEKNNLLETIREMRKIQDFNDIVVAKLVSSETLHRIEQLSWYNEETGLWVFPEEEDEESEIKHPVSAQRIRPMTADRRGRRPVTATMVIPEAKGLVKPLIL